jgi:membrane protein implicated in regulation of membrane protease activity
MTWSDFYLICFLVGFALSVISLLAGSVHMHLPHIHVHGFDFGHLHAGDVGGHGVDGVSPINFGTIAAFLAWFGGTGFLLSHYYAVWYLLALGIACASGIGGAAVVFFFLAKVLISREENLDPADYDMVGVLGKLSIPIRQGGTGEIVFSQAGTRHVCGARSASGEAVPKGAEVVVTRYEGGIAYVERWESLVEENPRDTGGTTAC